MAKVKISDYSTTANNNTDINSINIGEGCAPSGINDAIRELMRQLKEFQTGGAGDSVNSGGDFSVATNKFTVASATGNTAVAGTLGATGDFAVNTNKFTVAASSGNTAVAGTFAVTGATTLTGALVANGNSTLGDADTDTVTLNASFVNGTTLKSAKTATNTLALAAYDVDGTAYTNLVTLTAGNTPSLALTSTAVGTINNMSIGATTASTGAFTTLSASSSVTLSGGTANGVLYLNGSKVATSGSALVFDGTNLGVGTTSPSPAGSGLHIKGAANQVAIKLENPQARTFQILSNGSTGGGGAANGSLAIYDDTAGADRLVLDFSGNLGLGVTPSAWNSVYKAFELSNGVSFWAQTNVASAWLSSNAILESGGWKYKTTDEASGYNQSSGAHAWFSAASGTAGNAITFTQAMTLDASGRLGIGNTSPANPLDVFSSVEWLASFVRDLPTDTGMRIGADTSGSYLDTIGVHNLRFFTNATERARINSSGYFKASDSGTYIGSTGAYHEFNQSAAGNETVIIKASSGSYTSNVLAVDCSRNTTNNSFYAISYYNSGASATRFAVADSGNVTNTNNSYGAISDSKLKENITDATPKLEKLNQVRVVNYNFIGSEQKQLGVVAQELEQIFPGMVEESADKDTEGNDLGTTTKSVKYSVFVPMLIKAIQELKAEFDAYKASHP